MTKSKAAAIIVKPRRVILVNLSDTHAGHKLALMGPDVILHDEDEAGNLVEYSPRQTASQKYLWNLYQTHIQNVVDLADGDEICLLHNGDLTQGTKYPRELVSTRVSDQVAIAVNNLSPWFELPNVKVARIVIGTGAHNLTEGATELLAAQVLKASYKDKSLAVLYHGLLSVNGATVDYAHHGPFPGSREWLKGNVARFYLRDLMMREIMDGGAPPDLVLRAHYHQPLVETLEQKEYESKLLITPSYAMLDDHSHQATRSVFTVTHGLFAIEIVAGNKPEIDIHKFMQSIDIRTVEVI